MAHSFRQINTILLKLSVLLFFTHAFAQGAQLTTQQLNQFIQSATTVDQCDSTAQCRAQYGSTATDCFNSRSSSSVCLCGNERCDAPGVTPIPPTEPEPPVEPEPTPPSGDECNSTRECKAIYGAQANDCANSRSAESICMCGEAACYSLVDPDPEPPIEPEPPVATTCVIGGELYQYQSVELICRGLPASELDSKTFTDYRFNVRFSQGDLTFEVPGHFAADGNAANSSATDGDVWRAYFMPPTTGQWQFEVSFRQGANISVSLQENAGSPVAEFDHQTGSFSVAENNLTLPDMRARGLLQYIEGERYMRFAKDDLQFVSAGMDSPENIFGYHEFDNTVKYANVSSCKGILHEFAPHLGDWQSADPTWKNGKGKALIGLINYIASKGVNAIYMMGMTVNSDGCDAHPWTTYNANGLETRFDVSKLDQWNIAIEHMQRKGIMLHYMTQEQENDQLLNDGALGFERKLYYREIISRFAHHPALQWNLGEENTNTTTQRKQFASYIKTLDPYDHAIVMHTWPQQHDQYTGMLGDKNFDGATFQIHNIETSGNGSVYNLSTSWLAQAEQAGHSWLVTFTEASGQNAPRPNQEVLKDQRVHYMWASVMSGGAGFEWYVKGPLGGSGSVHAYDLAVEDLREFDNYWQQSGYLAEFFQQIVQVENGINLNHLQPANGLTATTSDWVLADPGKAYIIYLRNGRSTKINLPDDKIYKRLWVNPRTGERFNKAPIQGVGATSIGYPPFENTLDWVVLMTLAE